MTPDDTLALYLLSRSLWWRHDLEQLDAEAVAAVIASLEAAQKDIASRLAAEAAGLATLSDWRREQDEALNAWADEVLAGARATITGTVSEASIAAAAASLAAYNAILTLDGKASAVKSVGLTSAQIASWFQDTALGSGGLEHWVDTALDNGVKQSILAALRQVAVEGKGTAEAVRRVLVAASDAGFELTRREAHENFHPDGQRQCAGGRLQGQRGAVQGVQVRCHAGQPHMCRLPVCRRSGIQDR